MDLISAHAILEKSGVKMTQGLSDEEFAHIERLYGIRFPPDLRQFLSIGLPVSGGWPDWRLAGEQKIRDRLAWPLEGIIYDIENNSFWCRDWGPRPTGTASAIQMASQASEAVPPMIPIFSHRYIPAVPSESGNPVFSIYQTDVIYYGANLMDYFQNEFLMAFGRAEYTIASPVREIPFWSQLARGILD